MRKIVLVTGGFDPIHSGHIAYLLSAKALGDTLVVGVNSDDWLVRKKGKYFLPLRERASIVGAIKGVDHVLPSFNDDDGSAKDAILQTRTMFPNDHIIFANGGDRTKENIPEMSVDDSNISFVFGVGGEDKKNSSSWILSKWSADDHQT
jgi:cytidyltransferase-like protein